MKTYKTSKLFSKTCLVGGVLVLSGCAAHTITPDPKPDIEISSSFTLISNADEKRSEFSGAWWTTFERQNLSVLIDQALSQNYTVAEAVAVLEQARALSRQTGALRLPQIDAEADSSIDWDGNEAQRGTAEIGAALSWELDIWDRIGSAAKADRLEAQARFEDVETLKLSLSAEVANAYFGAAAAHQRLALLNEQIKLDRDLLNLLQLRLDSGVGTNLDVLQQKARVADSETLVPLAQADLAVFENRLDVLVGQVPDGQNRIASSETLSFEDQLPMIGVPVELLLNRPDLRSARAELVAADADIAAAIADRLPQITLDGSFALSDNSSYTGPVSMLMGTFVTPLLDWGRRKAEVARNKALYEQRLARYTQLFLSAVEETENALIREQKQREFLTKLRAQETILEKTARAAEERYTQGIDDYLPVISALQELRAIERNLITEQLRLVNIRIDLFRAIGGQGQPSITIEDK